MPWAGGSQSSTDRLQPRYSKQYSMSLLLTGRAYLWTTSRVLLTRVAYQEPKLSARLVDRDKDLTATADAHHRPVRVHAQRPGKSLQAKQSESLRAQDSAIQKPDQNRNNMSYTLYNHPYALNHIQLVKWTFDNYEDNIFKMLAIIYHRFHVDK